MINFACGQCRKPLAADLGYAGNAIACPACGTVTTVPPAESPLAKAARAPEELKERLEGAPSRVHRLAVLHAGDPAHARRLVGQHSQAQLRHPQVGLLPRSAPRWCR